MQPKELAIDGSAGNWATCEMQGFLIQFSLGAMAYNASLSMYYYLIIARNWSDTKIARRIEPFFHLLAVLLVLVTGIAGVALKLFNPLFTNCWIASYPIWCTQSYKRLGFTNCIRGDNAFLYSWFFFYAPLWISILISTICMALIFWHIRKVERAVVSTVVQHHHSRSKTSQFARQAMLYLGAFYLTWGFVSAQRILSYFFGKFWWGLSFTTALFLPMQGFFNALIYFGPNLRSQCRQRQNSVSSTLIRPVTGAAEEITSPVGSEQISGQLPTPDDLQGNGPLDESVDHVVQGATASQNSS
jgi:hypothetical protein